MFVANRNDPSVGPTNFSPFAPVAPPIGNPAIGFSNQPTGIPNVFGLSEATLRRRGDFEVHRAQLVPKLINDSTGASSTVPFGVEWQLNITDSTGTPSTPTGRGSTQRTDELWEGPGSDSIRRTPRLMSVGDGDLHVFGCAGALTENEGRWSTWLIESLSAKTSATSTGGVVFVQDLLNGDRYFVPNKQIPSAPLAPPTIGPPAPPIPVVSGPGNPISGGAVDCALAQQGDDLASRTLHMVGFQNGKIWHAAASNWGPVTQPQSNGTTRTFPRFGTVSSWGDVVQVISQRYPDATYSNITSVAIAAQGTLLHVFFVDEVNGRSMLYHTVRYPSGEWRKPVDVFAATGNVPSGWPGSIRVAAGACPAFGSTGDDPFDAELVVPIYTLGSVDVISVVRQPKVWEPNLPSSLYSPVHSIRRGAMDSQTELYVIRGVHVVALPF